MNYKAKSLIEFTRCHFPLKHHIFQGIDWILHLIAQWFITVFRSRKYQHESKLVLTIIGMEKLEKLETSWLNFLTRGDPEDIDESEKR